MDEQAKALIEHLKERYDTEQGSCLSYEEVGTLIKCLQLETLLPKNDTRLEPEKESRTGKAFTGCSGNWTFYPEGVLTDVTFVIPDIWSTFLEVDMTKLRQASGTWQQKDDGTWERIDE